MSSSTAVIQLKNIISFIVSDGETRTTSNFAIFNALKLKWYELTSTVAGYYWPV